jgi:hypothetical protein
MADENVERVHDQLEHERDAHDDDLWAVARRVYEAAVSPDEVVVKRELHDGYRVALENIEREATRESNHDPERDWQFCTTCKIALLARRSLARQGDTDG